MIVVMNPGASEEQLQHVVKMVEEMGLTSHIIRGTNRTVVAAVGDKRMVDKGAIENAPGVEKIVPILAPFKVASREVKPEPTIVEIGPAKTPIGGTSPIGVIAGPCSIEDRSQLLDLAEQIKASGAIALRGGAFKPRTSPYSFQGLAEEGLEYLAEARERTGLAVVTEVLTVTHVEMVAQYADVLQIGARNMQNFFLLRAVGEQPKPVLLKRGMSAGMDEFLLAAEYIISAGNKNVILCERGIRTFEEYVRNTLALTIIPAIKRVSHLPIIADPTHGTGHQWLVEPMSMAAVAAGADGLIIEVHPDPEHAMTDAAQQINPQAFTQLMQRTTRIAQAVDRSMAFLKTIS
ncbi:MAG: 3-deoxy-7-phosphoheptulonate synthase [Sedimentisphaerales bacterium]|nr:3-deoxy-7-phosphoheptulonate synthase [Sedimentisphaerales bacterium]